MANSGVSKLAQVIASRISQQVQKPDVLELGAIQADMSLLLDRFPVPIPAGDYLIADWEMRLEIPQASRVIKTASPVNTDGTDIPGTTTYSNLQRLDFQAWDPGQVQEVHLNLKASIKAGDRVLVAWVNDGTDPVVLCKVVT
ncbi:peptide methionine sulfoxide reductase [Moorella sp. E306M]|uniref:peptide methionine sulfoxide reductase n=1 Tax=Moorella sp. E306M TaxID=2572683 RepID=UPI0010FFBB16|nr:peptide methionine sulfoxide reductase [Moorella sp. E306M]GEA17489.1 hypothetical protein E306M_06230 [Moorella sp. E306M]